MANILDTIAENTRQRYIEIIKNKPFEEVKAQALSMPKGDFEFEKALKGDTLSFICEVKKASPSKGIIAKPIWKNGQRHFRLRKHF